MFSPEEILDRTIQQGEKKIKKSLQAQLLLGFCGGAMIALGYLAYIRVISSIAEEWGSFASFIGACVFPVGLIIILLAGGELITGNMMAVGVSLFAHKITLKQTLQNWFVITAANLIGALAVAYFFGHITGLTATGLYRTEVISVAQAKIAATPLQAFLSGIGCNWFVGAAVWLNYGAKDAAGKILAIWFPVMTFVAIGFQHSVANMFVIPAAIFEGGATWGQFFVNVVPVYLGNIVGGCLLVSALYYYSYHHPKKLDSDV